MNTATFNQHIIRVFRDWLPTLLLISLMLIARSTLADHYHVPSGSMEPSLLPGDHVVVNKAAYGLRIPFTTRVLALQEFPRAGDVVVFDSPENDIRLIKRVVAVGGDHVILHNGRLSVNGAWLSMPQQPDTELIGGKLVPLNLSHGGGPDIQGLTVPDRHVLVLGDHRGNSHDGRFFGTIPLSEVYGRASGVFLRKSEGPIWRSL